MKFPKKTKPLINFFKKNGLLILIILAGSFFRFFNLNWDQGHNFHPDERNIDAAVSRISFFDQLNPKFFAYGSLPIYLYRFIGEILIKLTGDHNWVYNWGSINLIGRSASAFFATLSIFLVYLLVKKVFGQTKTALWAAFLTAFIPSLIQTAHFAVTESLLAFWILILCSICLNIVQKADFKYYFIAGIILGLSLATKTAALSFLSVILATHFLSHPKPKKLTRNYLKKSSFLKKTLNHNTKLLTLLITAFLIFSTFSPFTFISWDKFKESMNYESGVVSGRLKVVYVLQFEKTKAYLFQIKNLFWQMGPAALLGISAIPFLFLDGLKKKDKKILVLLSFPIAYFAYVGSWFTKFIRYMVPLIPFLVISAVWLLDQLSKSWKKAGQLLIFLTLLATGFWGLAYFSIYTRESTRIAASKWIYQNIPSRAKILKEHWDDGLPVNIGKFNPYLYELEALTIYEPDNEDKIHYYAEKLSGADYIIINSRRLYGTLINLPEKYPTTSRYYQLLFNGKLGYQKTAQFTSYPSLFGIQINDDKSEETFQVYDHPKVIVFQNLGNFSYENIVFVLSQND